MAESVPCSVPNCTKISTHAYFKLPKDPLRAADWLERCGIEKKKAVRICEAHFQKNMFRQSKNPAMPKRLNKIAYPTLNLPPRRFLERDNVAESEESEFEEMDSSNLLNIVPDLEAEEPSNLLTYANKVDDSETLVSYTSFMENIIMKSMNTPSSLPSTSKDIPDINLSPKPEPIEVDTMEVDTFSTQNNNNQSREISALIVNSFSISSSEPNQVTAPIIDLSTDEPEPEPEPEPDPEPEPEPESEPEPEPEPKPEPDDTELMVVESYSTNFIQGHKDHSVIKPNERFHTSFTNFVEQVQRTRTDTLENLVTQAEADQMSDIDSTVRTLIDLQNKIQNMSSKPELLKMLAVKIYLKCPQGYEMMHRTLRLPPVLELKSLFHGSMISTDCHTVFASILKLKSEMLSPEQKNCILCLGTLEVGKNLYYDIKCDKLVGVFDINNIQTPELADKVLVLTMQGMYADWKQPIDIAFLSTCNKDCIRFVNQWIGTNISNLLNLGFTVRALVCETDSLLMNLPHTELLVVRNMYKFYDIESLLKWCFYTFLTHDFSYNGRKAKHQHILDYIELDSHNNPRLSPKLTKEMMTKPASIEDVNVNSVIELFSMQTAAAITTYINMHQLTLAALNTVSMIIKMSGLIEVLYADKCDNESLEKRKNVLCDTLAYLDCMKIVVSSSHNIVATEKTFSSKLKLTLAAILMLYKDANAKSLSAQRLSLQNLRKFMNQVKQGAKDEEKPTCKTTYLGFKQSALLNIFKSSRGKQRDLDLGLNLNEIKNVMNNFKDDFSNVKFQLPQVSWDMSIKSSEYNTWDYSNKDTIVFLAGFILKKCYDHHFNCVDMKNYIFIVSQGTNTTGICKSILKEIQENVCVVPQENFIEFIEMMEVRFRSFISKESLKCEDGFLNGLLKAVEFVTFPTPCLCFPMLYAKKLYLRIRIFTILKHNNKYFRESPEQLKYLAVNNL